MRQGAQGWCTGMTPLLSYTAPPKNRGLISEVPSSLLSERQPPPSPIIAQHVATVLRRVSLLHRTVSSARAEALLIPCEPGAWPQRTESAQGWCTWMTPRNGMGREVRGGFRMGNRCIPMADSCQRMAKTTTIL